MLYNKSDNMASLPIPSLELATKLDTDHNKLSDVSVTNTKLWPWLQVLYDKQTCNIVGRTQVILSKHLLNLRDSGNIGLTTPQLYSDNTPSADTKLDLLSSINQHNILPSRLAFSHESVSQLSLVMIAEIIWLFLYPILEYPARGLVRVVEFFILIGSDILTDISYYFFWVGKILIYPFKIVGKLVPSAVKSSPVYIPKTIYPRQRHAMMFLVMALLMLLPFKLFNTWQDFKIRQVSATTLALNGVSSIVEASDQINNGEMNEAVNKFRMASDSFEQATKTLTVMPQELLGLVAKLPGKQRQLLTALELLKASHSVSLAAAEVASVWATTPSLTNDNLNNGSILTESLTPLHSVITAVKPQLTLALEYLSNIDQDNLPAQFIDIVPVLHDQLYRLQQTLAGFFDSSNILTDLITSPDRKRYIILFQNSSELRATGGFPGSLAIIDVHNGKIESAHIPGGGPYDFQGQLTRNLRPPEPLRLLKGRWELQDATWSPDFPTSARTMQWFLEQSGGPSTDGVLAITPDIVLDLLRLVGPITLPQYAKVITYDNFMRETQLAVELEYDRVSNRPKQFIADLIPLLIQKILEYAPDHKLELVQLLEQALSKKSLQIYFNDPQKQIQLTTLGWSGELRTVPQDYLAVIRTNIRGGKTDAVISEDRNYVIKVNDDGSLVANLSIQLKHNGQAGDLFTGMRNHSYMRIYTPLNSELISTSGFDTSITKHYKDVPSDATDPEILSTTDKYEKITASGTRISQEHNKTVFGNWVSIPVGESRTITLTYRLPFTLENGLYKKDLKRYRLYVQRQAGMMPIVFAAIFDYGEKLRLRSQTGSSTPIVLESQNIVTIESNLMHDEYYGVILEDAK